jgi:hypothetical protein
MGSYQCGFRPGRSTVGHIFTVRQILEQTTGYNITLHHLFIDFPFAYNTITREKLFPAMKEFGFSGKDGATYDEKLIFLHDLEERVV